MSAPNEPYFAAIFNGKGLALGFKNHLTNEFRPFVILEPEKALLLGMRIVEEYTSGDVTVKGE
jgi:hypothetical protein